MSVNCEGVTTLKKTRKTPTQNRIEPHLASQSRASAMERSQDADPPQSPRINTSQTPLVCKQFRPEQNPPLPVARAKLAVFRLRLDWFVVDVSLTT